MAYSTLTLTFLTMPTTGKVLKISELTYGIDFEVVFLPTRTAAGEAEIPEKHFGPSGYQYYESIAENYLWAIQSDVGYGDLMNIAQSTPPLSGLGVVTFTAQYPGLVFEVTESTINADIVVNNQGPVSQTQFDFFVLKNIAYVPGQILQINSEENWSIDEPLEPWLQLSETSGSGEGNVVLTVVDYDEFPVGTEETLVLNVTIDELEFPVTVNLSVTDFIENPFLPGKLYFSKELNYLKFNSETAGTYINFAIEITTFKNNTYEPVVYNRNYKFPLFQGKGDFHVGTIVHDLFEEIESLSDVVPDLKTNYYKTQYRPAEVVISFEEKSFTETSEPLVSREIPMFKMMKGNRPFMTESQLALLTVAQQEVTRITPQSFISTSFVYVGTPRIIVRKNNNTIEDFEITPSENLVVYSYFRFADDFKPGDSIELIVVNGLETRSQRYLVFMNGLESTYFFFENDNGLIESYEFSGRRRINSSMKHTVQSKYRDLYSFDKKVFSKNTQSMTVNTGQLLKTDHKVITALITSPAVWCSLDNPEGPYFRVDATSSKVNHQDTSSEEESFDVEFNILENANVSIYPR